MNHKPITPHQPSESYLLNTQIRNGKHLTNPHCQLKDLNSSIDELTFIQRQDVDPEMRKELWRAIPKTSEW